jgi:hypothetical protein
MAKYTSVTYLDYKYTSISIMLCITYIKSNSITVIKSGLSINHKYTIKYPHYWIGHKSSISTVSLTGLGEGL